MKRKMLTVVFLLVPGLVVSVSAIGPLGPPTAGLKQGQFEIAGEYARSKSDLKIKGSRATSTMKGLESDMFLAQVSYGAIDEWEIYAILGSAGNKNEDFDFGSDFAYGFGTKLTFIKGQNLSWGALLEAGWGSGDASGTLDFTDLTDWEYFEEDYDARLNYNELMVAVGPTWEIAEEMRFYGGPFFYRLDGNIDVDIKLWDESISFDLEEKSMFGGYLGAEWDIHSDASLYGEFQFTDDRWVFGTGVGWKL